MFTFGRLAFALNRVSQKTVFAAEAFLSLHARERICTHCTLVSPGLK
jgi:hypothetical protein